MRFILFALLLTSCTTVPDQAFRSNLKSVDLYVYGLDEFPSKFGGTTAFTNDETKLDISQWKLNQSTQLFYKRALENNGITVNSVQEIPKDRVYFYSKKGPRVLSTDDIPEVIAQFNGRLSTKNLIVIGPHSFEQPALGYVPGGVGHMQRNLLVIKKSLSFASLVTYVVDVQSDKVVGRVVSASTSSLDAKYDDIKGRQPASDTSPAMKEVYAATRKNLATALKDSLKQLHFIE